MPTKSFLLVGDPAWLQNRQGIRHRLPETVQSWTYEAGSLTRRLRDFYGDAIKVKVLFHQWRTPFLSERHLLQVPEHRYCLIREVMLHANGLPLIAARTIIPEQTIKGAHRNLSHLGSRPLGEVIFSYPKLERRELEIVLLEQNIWDPEAVNVIQINQPVWGRRTVYVIAQRPMLVSEFFLPEALKI